MKLKTLFVNLSVLTMLGSMLTLQSCTIFSLHPLYNEEDLIEDPVLPGLWQDTDDGLEYVSFEKTGDKKYLFRYMEKHNVEEPGIGYTLDTVSYEAGLLKLGDNYFLDLFPAYEGPMDEEDYLFRNFIPTHSFVKIEFKEGNILLYLFNYDRLRTLFEQNRIRIKHEMFEDYIVITASTQDLQRFIKKYAGDEKAFDDPGEFRKTTLR